MPAKPLACLFLAATLAGCSATRAPVAPVDMPRNAETPDWRRLATPSDRDRLRRWRDAWTTALPAARAADAPAIAAQGALFAPDRALDEATPPAGSYRCRVFKLGSASGGTIDYIAYPWFACRIADEGDMTTLYKETGSQRPVGVLLPDGPARTVFLGTLMLGDERAPLQYGQDRDRDMAGFVERVGDRRWRLVLPWPRYESQLDIIELVPA
jgi:hypothetical protein